MSRSLYSLILTDEVVSAIDREAMRQNTNRSALVNRVLAEYVSYTTPEMRIDSIFKVMQRLLDAQTELVPFIEPNQRCMSVKSCLAYKYRPTIKYELELYHSPDDSIGELQVVFRTTSKPLLDAIEEFFRLWCRLEETHVSKYYPKGAIKYALYDGKFTRSIPLQPGCDYTSEGLAQKFSSYVSMFDALMKGCLTGRYTPQSLEAAYAEYLQNGVGII